MYDLRIDALVNQPHHVDAVILAITEQHKEVYGRVCVLEAETIINDMTKETYVMTDHTDTLLGFFSLSRMDFSVHGWVARFWSWFCSFLLGRVFVYDVFIFPSYRHKGLGGHMMKQAIRKSMKGFGVRNVVLHTTTKNLGKFYQQLGFNYKGYINCLYVHEYKLI